MSRTLSERRPVARKQHQCDQCCGVISPGDRYFVQRNVDGGDTWTWRAHELCTAASRLAYRLGDFYYEDYPDWHEEVLPLVLRFFESLANLAAGVPQEEEGEA